jgi:chromosome segregation ATPase
MPCMKLPISPLKVSSLLVLAGLGGGLPAVALAQANSVYYVCPGNVFTNTLSAKEADKRGCKAREAQQPTTIAGPRPRTGGASSGATPATPSNSESRVAQAEQRARDSDAKLILEQELAKAEEDLEALRREYRNGEPERRGDERNFQKYADRVSDMKAAISRKEADVAAIKRELAKLNP